ncbi:hypothetical protein EDB19DRAFT_1669032, partial [Suillus lakei]
IAWPISTFARIASILVELPLVHSSDAITSTAVLLIFEGLVESDLKGAGIPTAHDVLGPAETRTGFNVEGLVKRIGPKRLFLASQTQLRRCQCAVDRYGSTSPNTTAWHQLSILRCHPTYLSVGFGSPTFIDGPGLFSDPIDM